VDQPSRSKALRKFFCNGAQVKSHKSTEFWFSLFPFGFGKSYLYALGFMALVAGAPADDVYRVPRVSMASALAHGIWSFLKHYIFKLGFIDGWAGFVIAFGNFEGTFYRYAKRYEEAQGWQPPACKPVSRKP
jgi:hypothetical protein